MLDAIPRVSVDRVVPMEHDAVEAPGACRHQGVDSHRGRARRNVQAFGWTDRGFRTILGLQMCAVVVALLGVAPRCLVLLFSRAVPTVSASQAIVDFKDLWAPCKNAETAFPAFSPDGSFLRFILMSEHVFVYFGLTLAFLGILFGTFPLLFKTKRGKLLLGGFACLGVILAIATFVYVALNLDSTTGTNIAQLDNAYNARQNFVFLGLFITLVSFVTLSSCSLGRSSSWGNRLSDVKLSLLVCLVIIFCAQVSQIHSFLMFSVFRHSSEILGMIILQLAGKGLLVVLRSVVVQSETVRLPPYSD